MTDSMRTLSHGAFVQREDPLVHDLVDLAVQLPPEALASCRDLITVLTACSHDELAEVRQLLTAVRQLPGTPDGARAVMRLGADLVGCLDRSRVARDRADQERPGS